MKLDRTPVVERTRLQLKGWLLKGTSTGDYRPLSLVEQPSVSLQVQAVFDAAGADAQERLKAALADAIGEWRYVPNGYAAARELARLASALRCGSAVPPLGVLINMKLLDLPATEDRDDALEKCIGAVAGLAGIEAADDLLEQLYFDERVPPDFSAQLLIGLCTSRPASYPAFLPRWLRWSRDFPNLFRHDLILDDFLQTVGPALLAKHFSKLTAAHQADLVVAITELHEPPFKVLWDTTGVKFIALDITGAQVFTSKWDPGSTAIIYDRLASLVTRDMYAFLSAGRREPGSREWT